MEKSKRLYGLFGYLFIGIVAILTIYPVQKATIETQMDKLPVDPEMPVETLAIIALLNPFILLLIALIIGYFIADKVSFVSIVLHQKSARIPQLQSCVGRQPNDKWGRNCRQIR